MRDRPALRRRLLVLGVFGTAIFFGDGVITPAISVLSAIEGLEVAAPGLHSYVVPLTLVVLTLLFLVQRHGTGGIGRFFGPVTALWFIVLAVLGIVHIAGQPVGAVGAEPASRACCSSSRNPALTFIALGAVVLCVTGAEALYADMGHFGKRPIRLAWFGLVGPALVLNYFGQGAMLLANPQNVKNPFYEMAPPWALYPLIGLATAATVIASQALITAAFSVTKQAIQLGYLPRLRISHTSVREIGQIYVPFINWGLYVCIVVAVILFGSSSNLASAYGVAVTIDMLITTTMTFFVVHYGWKYPWSLSLAATGFFFLVDAVFFGANIVKVLEGGWFPLVIGAVMFTLMVTWKQGRALMGERLRDQAIDLTSFLEAVFVNPPRRVEGTAVFLVGGARRHAERLAAQPQAQQGAARNESVRHGAAPRGAVDRLQQALRNRAARPRLLAGHAALRLQERARRSVCAEAAGRPRRESVGDGDELFPVARHHRAEHRHRHGAVAREAVREHAPQRRGRGRLPEPADQSRGRARLEAGNLTR